MINKTKRIWYRAFYKKYEWTCPACKGSYNAIQVAKKLGLNRPSLSCGKKACQIIVEGQCFMCSNQGTLYCLIGTRFEPSFVGYNPIDKFDVRCCDEHFEQLRESYPTMRIFILKQALSRNMVEQLVQSSE